MFRLFLTFLILVIIRAEGFYFPLVRLVKGRSNAETGLKMLVKVVNEDTGEQTEIVAGSPLSLACVRTGMRLSFQCKAGTCGSCVNNLDGKDVFTCQTQVPAKKQIKIKKSKNSR